MVEKLVHAFSARQPIRRLPFLTRLDLVMKYHLVSVAALLLILGAPAAFAAPDDGAHGKDQDRADRQEHGKAERQQAQAPVPAAAPAQDRSQRQSQREARSQQVQVPAPATAPTQDRSQRQAQRQARPQQAPAPVQDQAGPQRQLRSQRNAGPQVNAPAAFQQPLRQAAPQVQGMRRDVVVPPRHVQQNNQWRSGNQDWNRSTVWQRDSNWWRGNAGFRNYSGARLNLYFAPGFGYYRVPRQYWRHSWHPGNYLPRYFLKYTVINYRAYGLPSPPYNCRWVWVNNSLLLVDRSDGYILDEVSNVW
jgi:Ni/Co efflux regulator RcnB